MDMYIPKLSMTYHRDQIWYIDLPCDLHQNSDISQATTYRYTAKIHINYLKMQKYTKKYFKNFNEMFEGKKKHLHGPKQRLERAVEKKNSKVD